MNNDVVLVASNSDKNSLSVKAYTKQYHVGGAEKMIYSQLHIHWKCPCAISEIHAFHWPIANGFHRFNQSGSGLSSVAEAAGKVNPGYAAEGLPGEMNTLTP